MGYLPDRCNGGVIFKWVVKGNGGFMTKKQVLTYLIIAALIVGYLWLKSMVF